MLVSVISPVYNEDKGISVFLDELEKYLANIVDYEVLLVDDGSRDNTWNVLQFEAGKRSNLKCIKLSRNFGKEQAIIAGLSLSSGDACIIIDSDLQHPACLIPEMVSLWRDEGYAIVEGVKIKRQRESLFSKLFSHLYYYIFSLLSGINIDGGTDYKLIDRRVVDTVLKLPEKQVFFRGIIEWAGFKHKKIDFVPLDRATGSTKWSFLKKINLALTSITSFTAKPLGIIWFMCGVFFLFSLIIGGEAVYSYLQGRAKDGFTTIILLTLITGFCILLSLAVISVYITQIFHEIKARPGYIIDKVIKSD